MKNKRFNLFDLLIIVIIIGIIAGIIFRSQIKDTLFDASNAEYAITIRVESVENKIQQYITEGTELYIWKSGELFGKVVSAEFKPIVETVFVGDAEIDADSEYYSSLVLTVSASGYVTDESYYTKSDIGLLIDSSYTFEIKEALFTGKITDLKVATQTDNG